MKHTNNLKLFCITNKQLNYLEDLPLILVGVGKKKFKKNYMTCLKGRNIQKKEKNYSELTFHYWFWKNYLKKIDNETWIGFCQKRRFWIKSNKKIKDIQDLKKYILRKPEKKWKKYESIICNPIRVDSPRKMKLLKRGWKNIVKDPSIILDKKKQNIQLQFDMHHGYGLLNKAIIQLHKKDRKDFKKFVTEKTSFNPHIMCISKKKNT